MQNIGFVLLGDIGIPNWAIFLGWLFYLIVFAFIVFAIYIVIKYFRKK